MIPAEFHEVPQGQEVVWRDQLWTKKPKPDTKGKDSMLVHSDQPGKTAYPRPDAIVHVMDHVRDEQQAANS